ncbi:MAG: HAMP domain-containing histidine kinase [Deltaproteobacteria bacterium]|nr:HAMP domain-containing histidine kinase [Deltaproteobacteria bacterium]
MTDTTHLIEDLEQIFSTLRHEFGNTVNTLNMTLDVLISNYGAFNDSTKLEFLHRASEQVGRQHRFLDAMRSYARAVVGETQEIPMISFWKECVGLAESRLTGKQIGFKQHIQAEPYSILISPAAIYQILGHLFDNAVDAVTGAESPEIELAAFTHPGSLVVQVLDNGPGIPAEIQSKVFLPFFTTREGHSGLGLSISRKMLSQMEGRIELINRLPSGTEASMWLKIT